MVQRHDTERIAGFISDAAIAEVKADVADFFAGAFAGKHSVIPRPSIDMGFSC